MNHGVVSESLGQRSPRNQPLEISPKSQSHFSNDVGKDRTIESMVYLYFLVSVGFILSVMYFISPQLPAKSARQRHEICLDLFCSLSMLLSIVWMCTILLKQQKSSLVIFMDLPKRYVRPLLIVVYLFGISCIVTDTITIWILIGCIKTLYFRFALTALKLVFSIVLMMFLRKYAAANIINVSVQIFHVLGTCVCLMLRTCLANSRTLLPSSPWIMASNCTNVLINPIMNGEDEYIIAFDQEFYITVAILLLIIWTNVKKTPRSRSKPLRFNYQLGEEQHDISMETTTETEMSQEKFHSITSAVQKEPHMDAGLVFGLTIGAILSIPYTFWWEKNFLTDKKIELFAFHLIFIVSMIIATMLCTLKLKQFPIPQVPGISFPVTVLLFILLFCCTWYSWFSILALINEMQRHQFTDYVNLAFCDHCLFFAQVVMQTHLILKAYSYCQVVLKPRSSNIVRQCILYLLVCNFVLWIHLVYFDLNHNDKTELQVSFYGEKLWRIVSKSTYPLCMYYRLFSSLCLFEVCFLF